MLHKENKVKIFYPSSAADLLQETMEYYGITQADLADRIGVSQKHVSELLSRKRYLNEVTALRVEKVMGISSHLLLGLDANYKLFQAEKEIFTSTKAKENNPMFLKSYDWVNSSTEQSKNLN